jgi:hypothetical protein
MSPIQRVRDAAIYRTRQALARGAARLQKLEARVRFGASSHSVQGSLGRFKPSGSAAIVITTFQQRQLNYCLPLVAGLRESGCEMPIVVVINGEAGGLLDEAGRQIFLGALSQFSGIQPVALRGLVGLARMWNLGIQAADTSTIIILNDDLVVDPSTASDQMMQLAGAAADHGLVVANGSWSMFAITRSVVRDVGWFEERLLGFGEEDGDYSWRYRQHYGHYPRSLAIPALTDIKAPTRQNVAAGTSKYSLVNRVFTRLKFDGLTDDMLIETEPPPSPRFQTPDFYPGETFRQKQGALLGEHDPEVVRSELSRDPLT